MLVLQLAAPGQHPSFSRTQVHLAHPVLGGNMAESRCHQGPGLFDVDLGISKRFQIRGQFGLRAEATFTNVFNHINFAPPATDVSNPATFGVLQSVLPPGAGGNRTGQVAVRIDF